jgi:hypothetical protein
LAQLGDSLSSGFALQALWQGENPKEERIVTVGEIAGIAGDGKLGTHVRYQVIPNQTA